MSIQKKVLLIIISTIILAIITYIGVWTYYYYRNIKPLIDKTTNYSVSAEDGFDLRYDQFRTANIRGNISLATKSFGHFGGNLTILQGTIVDENFNILNDYYSDLTVSLDFKKEYYVTIYKNTGSGHSIEAIAVDFYEVDKNMNVIDKDNHTTESMELFEANRDLINELRSELVRRFGEDNLFD